MRESMVAKGNLVGRGTHEMNRFAVTLCQPAAERQRFQIDVQADALGRVVRMKEAQRLARSTANIQDGGFGSQGRQAQKFFPESAGAAPGRLERELCAVVGQVAAQNILAARANDGSDKVVNYIPGSNPGDWQPTPPAYAPNATSVVHATATAGDWLREAGG